MTSILFILNESISLQEQKNKFPCHVYFSQTWWSPWSRTKVCSGPRAFCWLSTGLSVYNVISQVFVWKWFVTLIFPLRITHPLHSRQQKLHRDGSSEVRRATVMLQMGRHVIPTLLVVPHKGKKSKQRGMEGSRPWGRAPTLSAGAHSPSDIVFSPDGTVSEERLPQQPSSSVPWEVLSFAHQAPWSLSRHSQVPHIRFHWHLYLDFLPDKIGRQQRGNEGGTTAQS